MERNCNLFPFSIYVELQRQLCGVISLLSHLCGFWGVKSSIQTFFFFFFLLNSFYCRTTFILLIRGRIQTFLASIFTH